MTDTRSIISDAETGGGGGGSSEGMMVPPPQTGAHISAASARPANHFLTAVAPFCEDRRAARIITPRYSPDTAIFSSLVSTDPAAAVRFCDERLRQLRPHDGHEGLRWSNNLGVALTEAGDARAGWRALMSSRPLAMGSADRLLSGNHLHALAKARHALGEVSEAVSEFAEARLLYSLIGERCGMASADNNAALLLADMGRFSEARARAERAIGTWRSLGLTRLAAEGLDTMSRVYAAEASALRAR